MVLAAVLVQLGRQRDSIPVVSIVPNAVVRISRNNNFINIKVTFILLKMKLHMMGLTYVFVLSKLN